MRLPRSRWHLVAHRSELAAPGDFVCLPHEVGQEIALMNVDGEIVAFDNRCPHRGARIFTELRGNRPPVCGYHGRCAKPNEVLRFQVESIGDFLFVNRSPWVDRLNLGDPISTFLGSAPALRPVAVIRDDHACDWTVAVENTLDSEHVTHVHADSLARLGLRRAALHTHDGSSLEVFRCDAAPRLDRLGRVFPHRAAFDYAHAHLYPFACVASTRGWTYSMQHYLPRADGRTAFVSRLFAQANAPEAAKHVIAAVAETNARVFAEDAVICALVSADRRGRLGPRDDRIALFRAAQRKEVIA